MEAPEYQDWCVAHGIQTVDRSPCLMGGKDKLPCNVRRYFLVEEAKLIPCVRCGVEHEPWHDCAKSNQTNPDALPEGFATNLMEAFREERAVKWQLVLDAQKELDEARAAHNQANNSYYIAERQIRNANG